MMERPGRGLEWSHNHNSPFKLTKLAVMDFTRMPHNAATSPLIIDKPNLDTLTQHTITTVNNYKYLGVVFNPKLSWRAHITKVIAKATWWTHQLWKICKTAGSLSPSKTHQLYNTVAIPAFAYACNI